MPDFTPLYQETIETVRARLDADVNAGLAADDPDRIDTREGTFYYDITQSFVLELARLWDALGTEVPAAAFPTHAWGEYLDDHAETFGITRKAAVQATGTLTISGLAGAIVSVGTVFATNPATADADPIEFETTLTPVTLSAALATPTAPTGTASASGSFTAGTYYYFVSATSSFGETLPSVASSSVAVTSGQKVSLTWSAVSGATGYKVYRGTTATSSAAVYVGTSTAASLVDLGNTTYTSIPVLVNSSAGGTATIQAVNSGIEGNTGAGSITNVVAGNADLYSVANALATSGGSEVESDEDLRTRILLEYSSQGAGTLTDYKRWALSYSGVGKAYVEPVWNGGGTVLVVVNGASGSSLQQTGTVASGNVVLGLQEMLDPTHLDTGSGTVSSLVVTDSTKAWTVNQWVGKSVVISTKYGVVVSNTATTLTLDAWKVITTGASTSAPSSGTYLIGVTATGSGLGLAPIGAAVTVKTATPALINFSASVVLKSGYSLATETAAVGEALDRYFQTLAVGDDVSYRRVQAAFFEAAGVANVASLFLDAPSLSLSGVTTDIAIAAGASPVIASRGTVTLSASSA